MAAPLLEEPKVTSRHSVLGRWPLVHVSTAKPLSCNNPAEKATSGGWVAAQGCLENYAKLSTYLHAEEVLAGVPLEEGPL